MIKINKVTKKYENKTIVEDFSYEFNDCGLYFVVGESGVGKTTLLNLIGGIEKPTSGSITGNTSVSYVFQDSNLFTDFTVLENITFCGISNEDALKLLDRFKIKDLKDKKAKYLSGGERQRVAIARALAINTATILLDEPTGNLDRDNAELIFKMLSDISREKLVVVVTHDSDCLTEYGDVVLYFDANEIKELRKNKISRKAIYTPENIPMSLKYQLLYSFRLITTRKVKFVITLLLSTLSLLLLFFISVLAFYNIDAVVDNGIRIDNRSEYSISKSYYNNVTDELISYNYGEKVEDDLRKSGIYDFDYYKYIRINDSDICFNLIVENEKYDGVIITDFVSMYLFETIDTIDKSFDITINHLSKAVSISDVVSTDYYYKYDLFLNDDKYMTKYSDDYYFHYGVIRMSLDNYLSFFENGLLVTGGNFAVGDLNTSNYLESYYNIKYYYDEKMTNDDIVVSRKFYNKYMNGVQLPHSFNIKDIRNTMNEAKYYKYMNFYEIYSSVNVVEIIESSEYDVYISKEKYEILSNKYVKYSTDGICVDDKINTSLFHKNGFRISNSDYMKIYSLGDIFNNHIRIFITLVLIIIALLAFFSIYFSVIGFLDKKSKELFIMKCMKIPNVRIVNIFIIYILYIICFGVALSFSMGYLFTYFLNVYLMNDVLYIAIEPFLIDYKTYLVFIVLLLVSSLAIVIGPLYKLKRVDSAVLVKINN